MKGHFRKYLKGEGIDIGGEPDPLVIEAGTVQVWDKPDGNAQFLATVYNNSYDFVYSSHCLEHMENVELALNNWTRVLRPGGHLYVVVPDYLVYEKATWPSMFNCHHRQSFSLDMNRKLVGRSNHWKLPQDVEGILKRNGMKLVECYLTVRGMNWSQFTKDQTKKDAVCHITLSARKGEEA